MFNVLPVCFICSEYSNLCLMSHHLKTTPYTLSFGKDSFHVTTLTQIQEISDLFKKYSSFFFQFCYLKQYLELNYSALNEPMSFTYLFYLALNSFFHLPRLVLHVNYLLNPTGPSNSMPNPYFQCSSRFCYFYFKSKFYSDQEARS